MCIYKNTNEYTHLFYLFHKRLYWDGALFLCSFVFIATGRHAGGSSCQIVHCLSLVGSNTLTPLTSTLTCSSVCAVLLCVPVALHVHVCLYVCKLLCAPLTSGWTPLLQIKIKPRRGGGQMRRIQFCVDACVYKQDTCLLEGWRCHNVY